MLKENSMAQLYTKVLTYIRRIGDWMLLIRTIPVNAKKCLFSRSFVDLLNHKNMIQFLLRCEKDVKMGIYTNSTRTRLA